MVALTTYQYLESHLGEQRSKGVLRYLDELDCAFKLVPTRVSKLGDFRVKGQQKSISINKQANSYRFMLTLMHEMAHLKTYNEFGFKVKPHGAEWKNNYRQMMQLFHIQALFQDTEALQQLFMEELRQPKACAGVKIDREKILNSFDEGNDLPLLEELAINSLFVFRGKQYRKIQNRRTRVLCLRLDSQKQYTINKASKVRPLSRI